MVSFSPWKEHVCHLTVVPFSLSSKTSHVEQGCVKESHAGKFVCLVVGEQGSGLTASILSEIRSRSHLL